MVVMKHKTAAVMSMVVMIACYLLLTNLLIGTPGELIADGGLSTDEDWDRPLEFYPPINQFDGLHKFIYLTCIAVGVYTYYKVIQSYRQYIRK